MKEANDFEYGPWVRVNGNSRPSELGDDNQRIQCIYINGTGDLKSDEVDNYARNVAGDFGHKWVSCESFPAAITLAYRRQL